MKTGSWASDKHLKCSGIAAWSGMLWNNTQVTVNQKILKLVSKRKAAWLSVVQLPVFVQMVSVPLTQCAFLHVLRKCAPDIKLQIQGQLLPWGWVCPARGLTNFAKLFVVLQKRKKHPETLTCKRPCSLLLHTPGCFCKLWHLWWPERVFPSGIGVSDVPELSPPGFHWLSPRSQRQAGATQAARGKQSIEESNWVHPKEMAIFCDFQYKTAKYSHCADIALIMNNLYHSEGLWHCSLEMFHFRCIFIWAEIGVLWIQRRRFTIALVSV